MTSATMSAAGRLMPCSHASAEITGASGPNALNAFGQLTGMARDTLVEWDAFMLGRLHHRTSFGGAK
ncbi:protein of unknown function [Burkholderia multivorans]